MDTTFVKSKKNRGFMTFLIVDLTLIERIDHSNVSSEGKSVTNHTV